MMLDCVTCKWIRWSASIPLSLLRASTFLVYTHIAEVQQICPLFSWASTWPPGHLS